jgi:hypothetical protein
MPSGGVFEPSVEEFSRNFGSTVRREHSFREVKVPPNIPVPLPGGIGASTVPGRSAQVPRNGGPIASELLITALCIALLIRLLGSDLERFQIFTPCLAEAIRRSVARLPPSPSQEQL